jgi:molybdenum cofactor cytidylyltransferase
MLCDQPLVSTGLINRIAEAYRSGTQGIVACQYAGTVGPPALFDRRFLPELANLKGRQGAKRIIQTHRHDALFIPFPGGQVDIDTAAEYARLRPKR